MKILVVDDSGLARRMMRECLETFGHDIVEAADGVRALERFALERPDFVFLDLVMPGMTGFEVLVALRALDPGVRVIICSADIQTLTRQTVRAAGALAIINKPVRPEQISSVLNTILSRQDFWKYSSASD